MSLDLIRGPSGGVGGDSCALSGELCVFTVSDVSSRLLEIVQSGMGCEVDLSQVTEIDTAGVQLLLLIRREMQERGRHLEIVAPSEAVVELVALLGLSADLGIGAERSTSEAAA